MRIQFTKFVSAVSRATDFVEAELLNIPDYHEKRVAIMANHIGRQMGMGQETLYALTLAGALHDCALHEYLKDEYPEEGYAVAEIDMASHCIAGENVLKQFPFYEKVEGAVLHHHDRADGMGALRMKAEETPIYGQIIHIADAVDTKFSLDSMDKAKYSAMMKWVEEGCGSIFSMECSRAFIEAVTPQVVRSMVGEKSIETLDLILPDVTIDVSMGVMRELSTFFARITDYKSHFTWKHSLGIAEKAEKMGHYYGYSQEMCDKLYIAGALHDIGKLLISNDILEKPGKLTSREYKEIQNHAIGTWDILHKIGGMEDISRWAALHHEKLDGSGYPFGYTAADLNKHERLMACLDIYQALVEERPYKKSMSHEKAMDILNKMGQAGQLDQEIIRDIDRCHSIHTMSPEIIVSGLYSLTRDNRDIYEGESWICPVCGYVYEGKVPKDFICPRCEQPGIIFEKVHRGKDAFRR